MVDFPTGKCMVLLDFLSGKKELDERAIDTIYKCCLCRLCESWCVPKVKVSEIIRAARATVVDLGRAPKYAIDVKRRMDIWGNPYSESLNQKAIAFTGKNKADVLYFAGCTTRYFHPEIAESTISILKTLNVDFAVLENLCCGAPLSQYGFVKDAKKKAEYAAELINKAGCNTLIVSCPECYRTFKEEYKKHEVELLPEILHVAEYFVSEKPSFNKELQVTLTYHDPCALGRALGVYEQPRNVLEKIPGVKIVEMKWNRDKANCCGGTLGFFAGIAMKIAKSRINEAKATGAETLITACPLCKRMFSISEKHLKVLDLAEFIAQAIQ
jgi:Fe-S oxidoreductase